MHWAKLYSSERIVLKMVIIVEIQSCDSVLQGLSTLSRRPSVSAGDPVSRRLQMVLTLKTVLPLVALFECQYTCVFFH